LPYDPFKDFAAIGLISDSSPNMVLVNPELPVNTLQELLALAKARPGKLSYALDASGGYQIMIGRLLKYRGAVDMVEVRYKSAAQGIQDTVAGRTQVIISSPPPVLGIAATGKLRILALTSEKRFPGMEHLPTVWETFPGFKAEGWFALVGPAAMPQEVVRRANQELGSFLAKPEMVQRLLQLGLATSGHRTPEATAKFIRDEQAYWAKITEEVNFLPE
jgi:tripartite-type tricarboxylate transporter receptor subunit TctC